MKEAKQMVEESDIKYDEVARKLAMVSVPLIFIYKPDPIKKLSE